MSPFWILLELRMMEVVMTTGAISRAKLQSNHHHQQTNTQFFYRPDALQINRSSDKLVENQNTPGSPIHALLNSPGGRWTC